MPHRRSLASILLAAGLLAGCADDDTVFPPGPEPETVRVAFQDGVSPVPWYEGARDAFLKDGPTNDFRNGCYGESPYDTVGTSVLAAALYERRLIVKMDLSTITDCAAVIEASLSISFDAASADSITLVMNRVVPPSHTTWMEGVNGIARGVSWTTVDGGVPWNTGGGDIEEPPLDRVTIAGDSVAAFVIPPRLARSWIEEPAANHGVIIRSAHPGLPRFAYAYLRETTVDARRPRLEITYLRGG